MTDPKTEDIPSLPATKAQAHAVIESLDCALDGFLCELPTFELTAFIAALGSKKMRGLMRAQGPFGN